MANDKYISGDFEVKNRKKYKGDPDKVKYRSSYELHFYEWADTCEAVVEWSVENVVVPYYDPMRQKERRYIVDVWMKFRDRYGNLNEELIEIKPLVHCKPPAARSRKTKSYNEQLATYITNQSKWQAAEDYAKDRGWGFRVITEESIFKI